MERPLEDILKHKNYRVLISVAFIKLLPNGVILSDMYRIRGRNLDSILTLTQQKTMIFQGKSAQ